jgi:hypothetical protein
MAAKTGVTECTETKKGDLGEGDAKKPATNDVDLKERDSCLSATEIPIDVAATGITTTGFGFTCAVYFFCKLTSSY